MSDEVQKPLTGTVGYEYKVPNGAKYGNAVASIYVPFDAEGDWETNAQVALEAGKRIVYRALGIEYESKFDDDGVERAIALLEEAFGPGVVVEEESPKRPAGHQKRASGNSGGLSKIKVLRPLNDDHPEWLEGMWQWLVDQGEIEPDDNELWDNRKFLKQFGGNSDKGAWYKTSKGRKGIFPPKKRR